MKMNQDPRIKAEKTRLRGILQEIGEARLSLLDHLIGEVAFMHVALEDLQERINAHGPAAENGAFPEVRAYAELMDSYVPALRELLGLPAEEQEEEE